MHTDEAARDDARYWEDKYWELLQTASSMISALTRTMFDLWPEQAKINIPRLPVP